VVLALRLGLARLGHVALDGTKLKANTSKHKAMSFGRMRQREAQLRDEIARLVEQAEAQDTAEDQEYGIDSDGYAVAEELARREARLAKIRAARERLEAERRAEQGLAEDAPPVIADQEQRSCADPTRGSCRSPASTSWPASPTTSASCSASARSPLPTARQRPPESGPNTTHEPPPAATERRHGLRTVLRSLRGLLHPAPPRRYPLGTSLLQAPTTPTRDPAS
jgi:hypothetical protein